jgi:hypothetical protein
MPLTEANCTFGKLTFNHDAQKFVLILQDANILERVALQNQQVGAVPGMDLP